MNSQIFEQLNSILYKEPENPISTIKPGQKNIEMRFIVLKKVDHQITKSHKKIVKYWIADISGSAFLSLYDLDENTIKQGDIYYLSGAYATLFKGIMNIHQGKFGLFKKIDEFSMQFVIQPNVSLKNWSELSPNS